MAGTFIILKVSEEVAGGAMVCAEEIPGDGKSVTVMRFEGSGAFTQNSVVRLAWDFGGVAEETVWTIKGESTLPHRAELVGADGIKKLVLCLDNGEAGPVFMSGYAEVLIE